MEKKIIYTRRFSDHEGPSTVDPDEVTDLLAPLRQRSAAPGHRQRLDFAEEAARFALLFTLDVDILWDPEGVEVRLCLPGGLIFGTYKEELLPLMDKCSGMEFRPGEDGSFQLLLACESE